jgi:hypothetical protein
MADDMKAPHETDHDDGLLLDRLLGRLDALKVLRERDEAGASAALEAIGVTGKVEAQIVAELADTSPLAFPERFEESHRTVMRALEVLDRNGSRAPSELRIRQPFKVLTPLASVLVQMMVSFQVKSHLRTTIGQLARLYARREATCVAGSTDFMRLRLARKQALRLSQDYRGGGLGIVGLLAGGAALSVLGSIGSAIVDAANANRLMLGLIGAAFVSILLAAFWVIIQSAAIARSRIRIALDEPLRAMFETIGNAGDPPRDPTRQFVIISAVTLVVGWLLLPTLLGILLVTT